MAMTETHQVGGAVSLAGPVYAANCNTHIHTSVRRTRKLPRKKLWMPALEQLARQGEVGRSVEIEVEGDVPALLPAVSASVLYRVAQEALHNALKHADATHIQVTVTADDGSVEVRVKDDGRGFEHDAPESRGGMGLFVMKERVSLLDGSLTLRSAAGQGTEVIGRIPLLDETE